MSALLPLLICGGGMALCVVMMSRMHKPTNTDTSTGTPVSRDEVTQLREEVDRLRGELHGRRNERP